MLLDVVGTPLLDRILSPRLRVEVERPEVDRVDFEVGFKIHPARPIVNVISAVVPVVISLVSTSPQYIFSMSRSPRVETLAHPMQTIWYESIDLIYADRSANHLVNSVVVVLGLAIVGYPFALGSLANSQAKMADEFRYRITTCVA